MGRNFDQIDIIFISLILFYFAILFLIMLFFFIGRKKKQKIHINESTILVSNENENIILKKKILGKLFIPIKKLFKTISEPSITFINNKKEIKINSEVIIDTPVEEKNQKQGYIKQTNNKTNNKKKKKKKSNKNKNSNNSKKKKSKKKKNFKRKK